MISKKNEFYNWLEQKVNLNLAEKSYVAQMLHDISLERQTNGAKPDISGALPLELIEWWEGLRPEGWDVIQHLSNPSINCQSEREQKLAIWISCRLLVSNGAKSDVSGSFDADSNSLLDSVVNIFGRMYGKDKEFGETTVGGSLIEEIKLKLAYDRQRQYIANENSSTLSE